MATAAQENDWPALREQMTAATRWAAMLHSPMKMTTAASREHASAWLLMATTDKASAGATLMKRQATTTVTATEEEAAPSMSARVALAWHDEPMSAMAM